MHTEVNSKEKGGESFRFDIYKGKLSADGTFQKLRLAGHSFLRSGKHAYKVKLFTLTKDRFVIVPADNDPEIYKILTKEEVTTKEKGRRTYWNVVGEAQIIASAGLMKLKFDLFGEALYMSMYPANAGNVIAFQALSNWTAA